MSTRKSFDRVCIAVLIASLLLTALFMNGAAFGLESASRSMGYESRLFDASRVHTLAIVMDDWDGFLENCENEEYAPCTVVIDNESYKNVGLRAKGNTSLTIVRSLNSDRYSMKIEFDRYENGKTYYGLDKLCLNNIIQDNTYMRDYLTYRMMGDFGADAPLCSYVWITVNGEDWGLYLAVEGVEDAFLQRNYGSDYGDLYKPDSTSFGGGGPGRGRDFRMSEFLENLENLDGGDADSGSRRRGWRGMGDAMQFRGGMGVGSGDGFPGFGGIGVGSGDSFPNFDPTGAVGDRPFPGFGGENPAPGGGFGGGMRGMGSNDVKLKYTDDAPDSYGSIFDNAKTVVTEGDKARLIASLKSLGEMENLESVVDIDEVLRYFVVHNYVVNGDSYTGSMIHNYYIYEKNGQLSMIPWDYNLAFGGFRGVDASESVNDPIDAPLSVSGDGDRPMADWFLQGDGYTELYHAYFKQFLSAVDAAEIIDAAHSLIAPYVERDPTKFCTYEQFEKGVTALRTFCELRTESVLGQLNGSIPSTDEGQSADNSAFIDASGLTISDMGNMGFGGGRGRGETSGAASTASGDAFPGNPGGNFSRDGSTMSGGGFPGGRQTVSGGGFPDGFPGNTGGGGFPGGQGGAFPGGVPSGAFPGNTGGGTSVTRLSAETWISLGASLAVLFAGLLTARLYRRRKRFA